MQKIFNTSFEVSLRLLLLLAAADGQAMTVDRIAAYDFITIFSKDFKLSETSLHGDNEFGLSEFASRRHSSQLALRELVLDGAVKATSTKQGFCYMITTAGQGAAQRMSTQYAVDYKKLVKITMERFRRLADVEVLAMINDTSQDSIRR